MSDTETTRIKKLKAAVALISKECDRHTKCKECPLYHITCHSGLNYPVTWREYLGGKDDD